MKKFLVKIKTNMISCGTRENDELRIKNDEFMHPKYVFLFLISSAAILEAVGDVILKKWALGGKNIVLAA